ncbi:MAG: YkvA family protein [Methylotenera sp.]|nr:YkvA family protein [Methylotenera sp.]MDP1521784.1 YkvA family protein [Methylotenera sp.]MDP2070756.1 YkvA family protein [Methylotenera sp.]MDP3307823.1 YkvA family protein [Methylotenera sp.]
MLANTVIEKLKSLTKHLKQEFAVYRLVLKHPETPWIAKMFLGLAVGYLLLPFDLIPDFIPVLGQLDDVVIIPVLVYVALLFIPQAVIQSCREQVKVTI